MGLYCILRIRYGRLRRGACWRSRRGRRNGNNTNNNCWMRRLRLAMIHNNQMTTNHNHCQQINSPPPKPPSPTSQHGRVLGVASPIPPATVTSTATAATAASSTPTTGTVADPTKRRILYAGIAPGSTQVPSSINAVTGVHPNFIGEDAARAVAVAEDERKRMERLEENSARVALGATASVKPAAEVAARTAAPTTKIKSPPEGPATLAARARAVALASAAGGAGATSKPPRPNQPLPTNSVRQPSLVSSNAAHRKQPLTQPTTMTQQQQPRQPATAVPAAAPPPIKTRSKKPHIPLYYDDSSLTPQQQFEMRLQEARWRQRKRRRERRRQRWNDTHANGTAY